MLTGVAGNELYKPDKLYIKHGSRQTTPHVISINLITHTCLNCGRVFRPQPVRMKYLALFEPEGQASSENTHFCAIVK